jgi:sugar lactone lactonase YvrE
MFSALYAARDGMLYVGLCTHAGSGQFYQYNPKADRMRHIADLASFLGQAGKGIRTAGKIHTRPVEDRDGRIYFATMCEDSGPPNIDPYSWEGPHWIRYDPKADRLEDLGQINRLWGIYGLAIDANRNYLFGTAWDGHLYRYDINAAITLDLGRVDNWDDLRHIAADDDGNVYGCYPKARIWKYDARAEQVYDLSVQIPYDPRVYPRRLSNPTLDRKAIWRVVQWDPVDRAIYGVDGGSSILFRYDPNDGPEGKVTELARLSAERFYDSSRKDIPYSSLAFTIGTDRRIYFAPAGLDFDYEQRLEAAQLAQARERLKVSPYSELIAYDLRLRTRVNLGVLRTMDGRRVFGCGGAASGLDGTIFLGAAVEVKDAQKEAGKVAGVYPYAMELLIYRPGKGCPMHASDAP